MGIEQRRDDQSFDNRDRRHKFTRRTLYQIHSDEIMYRKSQLCCICITEHLNI